MNKEWTANEIIKALKEKGISVKELADKAKNKRGIVDYKRLKKLVAEALNSSVCKLWWSDYDNKS